ncbi:MULTISPECIES: peptide deformylase [Kocuria]|uniref:peptide deformylase n=1 Tax=Kocuria TaxID=57493 RepID=UPI0006606B8B|nr:MULTISPECIES: peptide deformylase [Kocuria]RUQ22488.1 peptide deformylase [Kocuria sp. HSID16901]
MTIRPIVITGEPVLHQPTRHVTVFDDELRDLVKDMYETMDRAHGVGLAATQVGVPLRLFTYTYDNDDDAPNRGVLINPQLTLGKIPEVAPDKHDESEGCLSVPGLAFPLKRAEWVHMKAQDEYGQMVEFDATGWFARVMQHETDHLDGKLYVDRLNDRWGRKARKTIKAEGWGVPGLTWMPGVDEDPFGHDEE